MTRFIAILIWISYIVGSNFCEASCFRLLGGARESEGLLQINGTNCSVTSGQLLSGKGTNCSVTSGQLLSGKGTNCSVTSGQLLSGKGTNCSVTSGQLLTGKGTNVCVTSANLLTGKGTNFSVTSANLLTGRGTNFLQTNGQSGVSINGPLIYRNKTGKGGIQMNNLTCQATMNETDACEKFTICCQKFGETIDACQNNTSHSVFTTNKLNKCLRTIHENLNNTYALIEGDNCKWTKVIICNETAQTFELLENKTVSMDGLHCVTVDVQNGTRNFSIAHCSSYLPSVCLKVSREKDNYTERPNRKTTTKSRRSLEKD
ncbi:hypothetical protein MAR_019978 [Mya arenaria]|uniref:Uncharacterized protein n=1 Tax=Mya arenaria TaxID=6604 RepID=A0ABY7E882_MYAAR|nr:hypothetical protein MAR_019978 [Mya arenaria]